MVVGVGLVVSYKKTGGFVEPELFECQNSKMTTQQQILFTSIGSPYEAPEKPDLVVSTVDNDVDAIVKDLLEKLMFRA